MFHVKPLLLAVFVTLPAFSECILHDESTNMLILNDSDILTIRDDRSGQNKPKITITSLKFPFLVRPEYLTARGLSGGTIDPVHHPYRTRRARFVNEDYTATEIVISTYRTPRDHGKIWNLLNHLSEFYDQMYSELAPIKYKREY